MVIFGVSVCKSLRIVNIRLEYLVVMNRSLFIPGRNCADADRLDESA
jgi:hypothetical protein